jgi:hypothetical protein
LLAKVIKLSTQESKLLTQLIKVLAKVIKLLTEVIKWQREWDSELSALIDLYDQLKCN